MERSKRIIRTSILAIGVNIALVILKAIIGLASNSIAILLDAMNNLSDALSSVVTIVGTRLAGKKPDKKHPYGYGRIEYITSVIIAVIVLLAGITSFKESAVKIIHPEAAEYSMISLILIGIAVAVKYLSGRYTRKVGREVDSGALTASGSEAFFDAVLSLGTLVIALINVFFSVSLEGWLGIVIAFMIVKTGTEILLETLSSIIGNRADPQFTKEIKAHISEFEGVNGAYDLVLHNYGPSSMIGSVHIEVNDDMTAREIHSLSRKIITDAAEKYGILLTVGIYAVNNTDTLSLEIRTYAQQVISKHTGVLQMHGFFVDEERKHVMFDMVIDFKADHDAILKEVTDELTARFKDYSFDIIVDTDFSD